MVRSSYIIRQNFIKYNILGIYIYINTRLYVGKALYGAGNMFPYIYILRYKINARIYI